MTDKNKTKKQLIDELASSRRQIKKLEKSESERKQAEEELEREKRFSETIINAITDTVFVFDPQTGKAVKWNRAFREVSGYTDEEIAAKKSPDEWYSKEDFEKATVETEKLVAGGQSRFEMSLITKDGSTIPTEYIAEIIEDEEGNPTYIVAAGRGISERKQAEEALHKERDFAESLINTAQAIILVLDTEGRMVRINPYMEEISGYSMEEVKGKDWFSTFLPKQDAAKIRKLFTKAVSDIQTSGNVNPIMTKDGRELEIEWYNKTLKDAKGNIVGVLAIGQDITARKQAEKKINASLKEKEVLLQEIHHRVKNNMQIVVSLLRLQSHAAKDKKIEDMFKVAQSRIRSMAIIHEKLYKSKDFAVIDFAQYIRSLTTHLMQTYQIDPKQINLKKDVKDIHLDINQGIPVGLILNELVSNALKHAFPKGKKGEIIVKFHAAYSGAKSHPIPVESTH